jgi:hypothetical protein
MPLYRAMDRLVCTPAGDAPPSLGQEPPESDDAMRARRSGKSPDVPFEVTGDKRPPERTGLGTLTPLWFSLLNIRPLY